MKSWKSSKTWLGALLTVAAVGIWSSMFQLGGVDAAPQYGSSGSYVDDPAAPRKSDIALKAPWKPEPNVAAGSAGTGEILPQSEVSDVIELSEEALARLPTIESVLGMEPETVCGTDTRKKVGTTTTYPWRANCHLLLTLPNNSQAIGTGWMGGRGTVFTAGHCVHTGKGGGWMKSVVVIPGRNGASRPYGSFARKGLLSVLGWTRDGSPSYDYAAITLNTKIGDTVGYYGFANYSDATLNNMLVNTAGYPGDKPTGEQWYTNGNISSISSTRLFYMMDTFGGQSGSIVYRYDGTNRYAVGIHNYGGCPNAATRVNSSVFNNLLNWRNLTQ